MKISKKAWMWIGVGLAVVAAYFLFFAPAPSAVNSVDDGTANQPQKTGKDLQDAVISDWAGGPDALSEFQAVSESGEALFS